MGMTSDVIIQPFSQWLSFIPSLIVVPMTTGNEAIHLLSPPLFCVESLHCNDDDGALFMVIGSAKVTVDVTGFCATTEEWTFDPSDHFW